MQASPLSTALPLFNQARELQLEMNAPAPTMPIVPLSKEDLLAHAHVQNFLGDMEKALRYAYVVGPVVRAVVAIFEMIGALFASATILLQAGFIAPENESEHAKDDAEFKREAILSNAQYTLSYAFHGLTNLIRAFAEITIVGHIILNTCYDSEFRHEYDLVNRYHGDRYHTRIFSPLVFETTFDHTASNVRHPPAETKCKGLLASINKDFNSETFVTSYQQAQEARKAHAATVKRAQETFSQNASQFSAARIIVNKHFAAHAKYYAQPEGQRRQLSQEQAENFRWIDEHIVAMQEKSQTVMQETALRLYGAPLNEESL